MWNLAQETETFLYIYSDFDLFNKTAFQAGNPTKVVLMHSSNVLVTHSLVSGWFGKVFVLLTTTNIESKSWRAHVLAAGMPSLHKCNPRLCGGILRFSLADCFLIWHTKCTFALPWIKLVKTYNLVAVNLWHHPGLQGYSNNSRLADQTLAVIRAAVMKGIQKHWANQPRFKPSSQT